LISFALSPDEYFLEDAGILTVPKIGFQLQGGVDLNLSLEAHKLGFAFHDGKEPGQWSLGRGDTSISFEGNELRENEGILLRLHQAIPVPHQDVPLAELLEFKRSRRAELLTLRHHLERLYQSILSAEDVDRAVATELSALDKAIADSLKSAKESKLKFRLSGLNAKLDWKTWSGGAAAYSLAATTLPVTGAILAGVAGAAAVSISATASIERKAKVATPFEYVSLFHDELFR
jgi:hypothetical protein